LALVLAALVVAAAALAIWQFIDRRNYQQELENMYTRSFYELVDEMTTIQTDLGKLQVATSPGASVELLSNLSNRSQNAAQTLSELPLGHPVLSDTLAFVNRLGDYCAVKTTQTGSGTPLTPEDLELLSRLQEGSAGFAEQLSALSPSDVAAGLARGRAFYDQPQTADGDSLSQLLWDQVEQGVSYPTMIYDGPFSEALETQTPKALSGATLDEGGAIQAAAQFLSREAGDLYVSTVVNGKIPGYIVQGDAVSLLITQVGGQVQWMMEDGGEVVDEDIPHAQAVELARAYLEQVGYTDLVVTWSQRYEGMLLLNFAPTQQGAVLYPDLIKVKVRLDNGAVAAFDATGYLMNHTTRSLVAPELTEIQAAEAVSKQLTLSRIRLAVAPTGGGSERLCWEVTGSFGERTYLIYLDAATGEEVEIFQIIDTDQGALAI
jgi:spore germination protein